MNDGLRVALLAADAVRQRGLAALVAAAGHAVTDETDSADVLLADAEAIDAGSPSPSIPIIVLGLDDPDASYAGILPRAPSPDLLDAAVRAVAAGLAVRAPPDQAEHGFHPAPSLPLDPPAPLLTPREIEVLAAIGQGLSNKEVARRLDISTHTVKFHLEAAFRKLGATTRAEAVAKGLRRRLIEV